MVKNTIVLLHDKISPRAANELTRMEERSVRNMNVDNWRLADPNYDSQILNTLQTVYDKFGISKKPRFIIHSSDEDYSASYNSYSNSILISERKLKDYTPDELEAVFAHEVGHEKQRPWLILQGLATAIASVALAVVATRFVTKSLGQTLNKSARDSSNPKRQNMLSKTANFVEKSPLLIVPIFLGFKQGVDYLMDFPRAAFSRLFEKDADAKSIKAVQKPQALISGLRKSEAHNNKLDKEWEDKSNKPIAPTDPDKSAISEQSGTNTPPTGSRFEKKIGWRKHLQDMRRTHPEIDYRERLARETAQKIGIDF